MKITYYVAVGDNGGIITDSYDRAMVCQKYLRGHIFIKKQSSFEEAEGYLLDHLVEKAPFGCPIPDHFPLNKVITIKRLRSSADGGEGYAG